MIRNEWQRTERDDVRIHEPNDHNVTVSITFTTFTTLLLIEHDAVMKCNEATAAAATTVVVFVVEICVKY